MPRRRPGRGHPGGDRPRRARLRRAGAGARSTRGPGVQAGRRSMVVTAPSTGLRRPAGQIRLGRRVGRCGVEPARRAVDRDTHACRQGPTSSSPRSVCGIRVGVGSARGRPGHDRDPRLDRGRQAPGASPWKPPRCGRSRGHGAPTCRASGLVGPPARQAGDGSWAPSCEAWHASHAHPDRREIRHAGEPKSLDRERCRGCGESGRGTR